MPGNDQCASCGHPFGEHAVCIAVEEPKEPHEFLDTGGIILCPEPGCLCFQTWGPEGMPARELLSWEEKQITELRELIQAERAEGKR